MFSFATNSLTLMGFVFFYAVLGTLVDSAFRKRLNPIDLLSLPRFIVLGFATWPILGFLLALGGWFIVGSKTAFIAITVVGVLLIMGQLFVKHRLRTLTPSREGLLVLAILIVGSLYFANIATEMFWASAGDAVSHATLTAILQQANLLPTASNSGAVLGIPLSASSIISVGYPPGFPISAALMGVIGELYPGRAVLLDAALISIIMPIVVFKIAKVLTNSMHWSTLSAVLVFWLPDGVFSYFPGHDLIMASLINGTYPNHMGNLLLLGMLLLLAEGAIDTWKFSTVFAGLLLAYPPFFLYSLLIIAVQWARLFSGVRIRMRGIRLRALVARPSVLTIAIMMASGVALFQDLNAFVSAVFQARSGYSIIAFGFRGILGWPLVLLPLTAAILSIFLVSKSDRARSFLLFYLAFLVLMIGTLDSDLYNQALFLTFPSRVLPLFTTATTTVLACLPTLFRVWAKGGRSFGGSRILGWMVICGQSIRQKMVSKIALRNLLMFIVLVMVASLVLLPYVGYVPFAGNRITQSELQVLQNGLPEVPTDALILNDRSFAGFFLPTVELRKVVNIRSLANAPPSALQRALETNVFLNDPRDYNVSIAILRRWNVSYVFISSDYYVIDLLPDGSYSRFIGRSWIASVYIGFFDSNPYLSPLSRVGNSGLYQVH